MSDKNLTEKNKENSTQSVGLNSSQQEMDDALEASPLLSHLIELRERILKSLLVLCFVFLGLVYFSNAIYEIFARPLQEQLPEGSTMIATGIVSPFMAPFKLTLVVSLFLSMPYILYQIWSFVAPGLYKHEKQIAFPLLFLSVVLFYTGLVFAYFLVLPVVMGFLMSIAPDGVQVMPDINAYLSVALKLFFAFGLAFEIPVATTLLVWSGVMTVEDLKASRSYVLVGCFVVGMLLTPPDVLSQIMLAVPMYILFEVGILLSRLPLGNRKSD